MRSWFTSAHPPARPPPGAVNSVLLDQLPPLAGLQRFLDELQLMAVPEPTEARQAGLLLETSPALYDAVMRGAADAAREAASAAGVVARGRAAAASRAAASVPGDRAQLLDAPASAAGTPSLLLVTAEARARPTPAAAAEAAHARASGRASDVSPAEWRALAERMAREHFPPEGGPGSAAAAGPLARLADLYNGDALESLLGPPKCNRCGAEAPKRCSRCRNVWYCGRACQVADWDAHKAVCDVVHAAGSSAA